MLIPFSPYRIWQNVTASNMHFGYQMFSKLLEFWHSFGWKMYHGYIVHQWAASRRVCRQRARVAVKQIVLRWLSINKVLPLNMMAPRVGPLVWNGVNTTWRTEQLRTPLADDHVSDEEMVAIVNGTRTSLKPSTSKALRTSKSSNQKITVRKVFDNNNLQREAETRWWEHRFF